MGSHDLDIDNIIKTNETPESIFSLVEKLGEGSYGKVWKALNMQNNQYYTVKIVSTRNQNLEELKKDINILRDCKIQYITRYYGSYLYNEQLWIIMEYCDIGSIYDLIKASQRTLNEVHIACILQGILQGLKYLHNSQKIHLDIKAGNIFINKDGICKLADFGVSAEHFSTMRYIEQFIGSPFWMSPEILSNKKFNKKTDIWSLGITAIEMAEGNPPNNQHKPNQAMIEIILRPPKGLSQPIMWSQEFNRFVSRCLTIDQENRPDVEELLLDPFIVKNTSIINPQEYLKDFVLENMENIKVYRKKLINDQKQMQNVNKNNQMKQNDILEQEKQPIYLNQVRYVDKIEESSYLHKDDYFLEENLIMNQKGTVNECQNYEEFSSGIEQLQKFYKNQSIQKSEVFTQQINNIALENELGILIEKIENDDQVPQKMNNYKNNFIKLFSSENEDFQNINKNLKRHNDCYLQQQNESLNQTEENQINNSVIIKEDYEIEHIKGQAYSGVMLSESEQKQKQRASNFKQFVCQKEDNHFQEIPQTPTNHKLQLESTQQIQNDLQKSFIEDDIPIEYRNMDEQMIEGKIKSLEKELEMDIKSIQELYAFKISQCQKALSIIKSKQKVSFTPNKSQLNLVQIIQTPQLQSIQKTQNQQLISPIQKSHNNYQSELSNHLKTPTSKEQNFVHISNLPQQLSINNFQNQQKLSPINQIHSQNISYQSNDQINKISLESNNPQLFQYQSVQLTNIKKQEPLSPIQSIEHIDCQQLPSPQYQQKYYQQTQSPLISQNKIVSASQSPIAKSQTTNNIQYEFHDISNNLPKFSQSPYIKSSNYNEIQYDQMVNQNLINSSLKNIHQITPKSQNKFLNVMQSNSINQTYEKTNNIYDITNSNNLLKNQNPNLSNNFSEIPFPTTPKPKEIEFNNYLANGVQTQPTPNISYSNCFKNSSSNINNFAQFTNGIVNLSNINKQQDETMNSNKRQFSNNNQITDSKKLMSSQLQKLGIINEESQQRKSTNHPINLLHSSKNLQSIFECSSILNKNPNYEQSCTNKNENNNQNQLLISSNGGISFEQILNQKNIMKQNKGYNILNKNSHNTVYDENEIYKQQTQMQQQKQLQSQENIIQAQQIPSYIIPFTQPSTPSKHSNIPQQKQINDNREFPITPKKFQNSIMNNQNQNNNMYKESLNLNVQNKKQIEQYNQELSLFQSIQSQQYEQLQSRMQLNQKQESLQTQQTIDNQQQQQQDNYLGEYNQFSNKFQKNNIISTNKLYSNSPSNSFMTKISDNHSSFNSSSIHNLQYSPGFSQISQNISNSKLQIQQKNMSIKKQIKNNEINISQKENDPFLLNTQKVKNNNSYLNNKYQNINLIEEQKYHQTSSKNNPSQIQKQHQQTIKLEEQSNSIRNISQINQSQNITKIQSSNNFTNINSFKQLLNQQNERNIPFSNNYD